MPKNRNRFQQIILKDLFFKGWVTSSDLSETINKSLPITIKYVNELIEEGLVEEKGFAPSTGGRRPHFYGLKTGEFGVLCVAMDQLITKIAWMDADGELAEPIEKHSLPLANNPNSLEQLTDLIENFIKARQLTRKSIVAIGIGMPGFIDSKRGLNHSYLSVPTGSIVSYIQNRVQIPVLIDNDSSLIALAALKWGAAQKKQNVMVINIGWGVGLGIIANGKLFKGHNGFAGEFSHMPLFDNNKLCGCGKYGCLETEASLTVVTQKAIERLKNGEPSILENLSLDDIEGSTQKIIEAAKNGDKFSVEVISESAYHIGRGIAILIHLLNPELVIISGLGANAGKVWVAPIQQAINEHCIPKIAEQTEIRVSTMGENAELRGAGALVVENYETIEKFS